MLASPVPKSDLKAQDVHSWLDSRIGLRQRFLSGAGWVCERPPVRIGEDCAFRRYLRLSRNGRTAILLESLPDDHPEATAGHRLSEFMRIGRWLQASGINAPAVYAYDLENGYLLLEDLGDETFLAAINRGVPEESLYALAVDVLKRMVLKGREHPVTLAPYEGSLMDVGCRRLADWYAPTVRGSINPDALNESFFSAWEQIHATLPPVPQSVLHGDFHVENLMWIESATGLDRCGVLDFQDARLGPEPYDLANLLEDARRTVPEAIRVAMLNRYCADMTSEGRETFRLWYRVLATRFHCRVLGQFIRLAVKDGKFGYLKHIPRLEAYIEHALPDPVLAPLKAWVEEWEMTFCSEGLLDAERIRPLIRQDAY